MYKSHKHFKKELKTIFKNRWIPVSFDSEFRDSNIIPETCGGTNVILAKSKFGLKGFHNVCMHRGAQMVCSSKNANILTCPYHAWTYDLNGSLRRAPGIDIEKNSIKLLGINVQSKCGVVFACQNNKDENLDYGGVFDDITPYSFENLHIVKKGTFIAKCNWKILVENFSEYYHLPTIHPSLVEISKVQNHTCIQKQGMYIGFETYPITNIGPPLDNDFLPRISGVPNTHHSKALFHVLFPNTFWFIFPTHVFSVNVTPVDQSTSIEHARLHVSEEALNHFEKIDQLWKLYEIINQEDIRICEKVQIGLENSGFDRAILTDEFERSLSRFHKMYLTSLEQ